MQTRSADEPMTTFVYCNECGNRWKVRFEILFIQKKLFFPPIVLLMWLLFL